MSDTDLNKSVEDAKDEPNERTPLLTGGGPVYNTPRELIESCSLSQYVKAFESEILEVMTISGVEEVGGKQARILLVRAITLDCRPVVAHVVIS